MLPYDIFSYAFEIKHMNCNLSKGRLSIKTVQCCGTLVLFLPGNCVPEVAT